MIESAPSKAPNKYAEMLKKLPIETKRQMAEIHRAMREHFESWEQALRGDTTKLEARVKARIATDDELELVCDLAAGRVNGKQYLKHLNEEITRELVGGHFLEVLRANPSAKLTKQLQGEIEDRFNVRHSLAAEIWAKIKSELAEDSTHL